MLDLLSEMLVLTSKAKMIRNLPVCQNLEILIRRIITRPCQREEVRFHNISLCNARTQL